MRLRPRYTKIYQLSVHIVILLDVLDIDAHLLQRKKIFSHLRDPSKSSPMTDQLFYNGTERLSLRNWQVVLLLRTVPFVDFEGQGCQVIFSLCWYSRKAITTRSNFPVPSITLYATVGAEFRVKGVKLCSVCLLR